MQGTNTERFAKFEVHSLSSQFFLSSLEKLNSIFLGSLDQLWTSWTSSQYCSESERLSWKRWRPSEVKFNTIFLWKKKWIWFSDSCRMVPLKFLQLRALLKKVALSRIQKKEVPIIQANELVVYGNACTKHWIFFHFIWKKLNLFLFSIWIYFDFQGGMVGLDEILLCAHILHMSGIILYYQGVPSLKDIVVLRPDWLANFFAIIFESNVQKIHWF